MVTLNFTVKKQRLLSDRNTLLIPSVSDTVNYYKCEFQFDKTWNGFEKRVYFKNVSYNVVKSVLLDSTDSCFIPWEVLEHTGVITCNVVGLKYSNNITIQRLTTRPVSFTYQVDESILAPYDQRPLTPTEYEQFRGVFNSIYTDTVTTRDEVVNLKGDVENSAAEASGYAERSYNASIDSEAFATGYRNGEPVDSGDPAYEHNAQYFSEVAEQAVAQIISIGVPVSDVEIDGDSIVRDGVASIPIYDGISATPGLVPPSPLEGTYGKLFTGADWKTIEVVNGSYRESSRLDGDFAVFSVNDATTTTSGLMSATDKVKLDNIVASNITVYDLGTLNVSDLTFIPTAQQISDVTTMWNNGFCVLTFTVDNVKYHAFKSDTITYNGISFMGFVGTEVHLSAFSVPFAYTVMLGISSTGIGLFATMKQYDADDVQTAMSGLLSMKQDLLESGTNIKTINNTSLLGSGNIDIQGGGGNGVFIATLGSTTYQEIASAINSGKTVVAKSSPSNASKYYYSLAEIYDDVFVFHKVLYSSSYYEFRLIEVTVDSNDQWDTDMYQFAAKYSPNFSGTPTAPTATAGTNTTQIATTAFVQDALSNQSVPSVTTPTINISTTSGTLESYNVRKYGNVVQLQLEVSGTSTSSHPYVFFGAIETTGLRPLMRTITSAYDESLTAQLLTDGTIYVKIAAGTAYTSGSHTFNNALLSFTYIVA